MNRLEKLKQFKYEDYWPKMDLDLQTVAGAMEVGKDLFLLGSFGSFGGCFLYTHSDFDKAKAHAIQLRKESKYKTHVSVYRLTCRLEDECSEQYDENK